MPKEVLRLIWTNLNPPNPAPKVERPEYGSYPYFLELMNGDKEAAVEAYVEHMLWDVPRVSC